MLSYWEQQSLLHYDHIVIGSGIVGLHTAIELKEQRPAARVLVLERSLLPYGASTRNAGFACMGSFTELLDDLQDTSTDAMTSLFLKRKAGLELLRQRLGDTAISYRENGSYELLTPGEMPLLEQLPYVNGLIEAATGTAPFRLAGEQVAAFGFDQNRVATLIENTMEGELHTGNMMRTLMAYALTMGIEVKTGAHVQSFTEEAQQVVVQVKDGTRAALLPLSCRRLFICTNAFTTQLLPGTDVTPGRGQVLVTTPVAGLPFRGIFHFDKGYYYFREIDGRVLFGGGRNLDFEGETTTTIGLHNEIQTQLETLLHTLILPGLSFEIEQRWSGIMAFGRSKQPIVQSFGARVSGAFRMGGMGVALGAAVARELVANAAAGTGL